MRFVRSFKQINARPTLASVTVLVHLYFYALRFSTNPPSVLGVRLLNTKVTQWSSRPRTTYPSLTQH